MQIPKPLFITKFSSYIFPFLFLFVFLASKLETLQQYPKTQPSDFCMAQDVPIIGINLGQKRVKLAMIKSMRPKEVHNRQHNFHNMFKLQSSDDAVKFHVKFWILFVHFSPVSINEACIPSNRTWRPVCCNRLYLCPSRSLTHSKEIFPCCCAM